MCASCYSNLYLSVMAAEFVTTLISRGSLAAENNRNWCYDQYIPLQTDDMLDTIAGYN